MKTGFTFLLLCFSIVVFAQPTVREQFEKIKTQQDAQKFIDANAPLKPTLLHLTLGKDSTLIDKRLLKQKKGDIFSVGYVTYLVLDGTESVNYRAQYIFLDGGSLSVAEIDSLKKVITQKIAAGESVDKLSDQYTMDGNTTKGDTGWFFGEEMMPKEFQEAVKNHKKDDVFFVDVPQNDWHYIVKKTYDDEVKKEITVLRANGR
ncbi:MAG: peptidylprolyl isomerase [Terrimonas sp.]|uniref:peptidylprolyl isomerase n=1 Tax=Terrimonas sp. TaxID=1914338 RepID=UPI00092CBAC7|nr:peptidylprolyl isomerase [Terrimonas sp.]MBN8787610.1 peptidylprolyl isomerase [Terrimonas sp.]OJY83596.1 MAG: hypothetical protein BGP13_13455 [Sphingobacteriales bacterium 40-81]PVD50626.1 hypothetical protein DC498_18700 [Terrimonas sp.]